VPSGFLVVDKPGGITSNAVVSRVKKATGINKVGHAGTLDPMATGMVVAAVGPVTRLIRYIQDRPKEYLATAEFGVATDTLDADGSVLSREPMEMTIADLEAVKPRFLGTIHQVPPMVSALRHEGRRLYELAREGVVIERDAREVRIDELEFVEVGPGPYPSVEFRVVCGKGTYVRSLADDIAGALGGSAHLTALRRTRTGALNLVDHGIHIDDLENWQDYLLTPSEALSDLPGVTVGTETESGVRNGVRFVGGEMCEVPEGQSVRVLDSKGSLIAVYVRAGESCRPEVVLPVS
jgi:tRNA pseudouridine55 synthase